MHFNNPYDTEEKRIRVFFSVFFSALFTSSRVSLIFASVCRSLGFVHSQVDRDVLVLTKHTLSLTWFLHPGHHWNKMNQLASQFPLGGEGMKNKKCVVFT